EWPIRGSDVLCSFRISHCVHQPAAMGSAVKDQRFRFLQAAFRENSASIVITACGSQPFAFRSFTRLCGAGQDRRAGPGNSRGPYVSHKCAGGAPGIFARQLGCALVAFRGGDVLSLLSSRVPRIGTRQTSDCVPSWICSAWPVWANPASPWERNLGRVFISGRDGCDCARMPYRAPHSAIPLFSPGALGFGSRRHCADDFYPWFFTACISMGIRPLWIGNDTARNWHLHVYRGFCADPLESTACGPPLAQNWPIQLRDLPHPYVRRVWFLYFFRERGQADASCSRIIHCRGSGLSRSWSSCCGALFRAHESSAAKILFIHLVINFYVHHARSRSNRPGRRRVGLTKQRIMRDYGPGFCSLLSKTLMGILTPMKPAFIITVLLSLFTAYVAGAQTISTTPAAAPSAS